MCNLIKIPKNQAFIEEEVVLNDTFKNLIIKNDWNNLDKECNKLIQKDGQLYKKLKNLYPKLELIEYILSLREAENPYEEDGVWHDDGSRNLAFSLGLNLEPSKIYGGELLLRKKNCQKSQITIPPILYGKCIIFQTGYNHFEHKICQVKSHYRLVMAGWCS